MRELNEERNKAKVSLNNDGTILFEPLAKTGTFS